MDLHNFYLNELNVELRFNLSNLIHITRMHSSRMRVDRWSGGRRGVPLVLRGCASGPRGCASGLSGVPLVQGGASGMEGVWFWWGCASGLGDPTLTTHPHSPGSQTGSDITHTSCGQKDLHTLLKTLPPLAIGNNMIFFLTMCSSHNAERGWDFRTRLEALWHHSSLMTPHA